jgi:RNA polymerase sigma-70 factor (ECF subfamily)
LSDFDPEIWFIREVLPQEGALRAYLGRFFAQPSDVDDTVQDTYARLVSLSARHRSRIQSTPAFLRAAARNVALDRLRKQRVISLETMAELDHLNVMDERPSVLDEINTRQELALLRRAMAALPERCRQVLTLRKVFGLSQKEISARLSISENTVESQVANGMRACAAQLYALMEGAGEAGKGVAADGSTENRGNTDVE